MVPADSPHPTNFFAASVQTAVSLDDYRWLVGPQAAPWLAEAAEQSADELTLLTRLRKVLSPPRAHLVVQQAQLRRRAAQKFSSARQMFFTPVLLEQATDEAVAAYKAGRFPRGTCLADLCCGIGGDSLALAQRGSVRAVDRDAVAALLAEANARVCGCGAVTVTAADALATPLDECSAAHIDPDRRPEGRRTTRVELHEPSLEQIEQLRRRVPDMAVKLAPGSDSPDVWRHLAEWEWIGRGGQCRQLVAWLGSLGSPGMLRATVLDDRGTPLRSVVADDTQRVVPVCSCIGRYVYEPDAAVLAAGLEGALAEEARLESVSPGIGYFTSDARVDDAALAAFEVLEQWPFDVKKLRTLLRDRGIGSVEIKKRGVAIDPEQLRRTLAPRGDQSATLIITPLKRQTVVLFSRRLTHRGTPGMQTEP